jgi:hypothetical protein
MKKWINSQLLFTILMLFCFATLNAQDTTKKVSTATLNKELGIYIFPAKKQTPEQQQKDEKECYDWAVKNSGIDPLNLQKVEPAEVEKKRGGTVAGAAKGAAAGAAIGAIAGDAGTGAGVGAAAGALAGRRAKKKGEAQQQQKAQADADAANKEQINSYKKAYTACLTGKGYTVQ